MVEGPNIVRPEETDCKQHFAGMIRPVRASRTRTISRPVPADAEPADSRTSAARTAIQPVRRGWQADSRDIM